MCSAPSMRALDIHCLFCSSPHPLWYGTFIIPIVWMSSWVSRKLENVLKVIELVRIRAKKRSCISPTPHPVLSCCSPALSQNREVKETEFWFSSNLFPNKFCSQKLTRTAQTADWITSLTIDYVHQCPAWPGCNWSWWDANILSFFT